MERSRAHGWMLPMVAACALAGGCDAFSFGVSGEDAPVKRIAPSEAFTMDGFGSAVAGVEGEVDGAPVSRLVVSGGESSAFAVYGIWRDDGLDLGAALFDACEQGSTEMCGGSSGAIGAAPQWVDNTGGTQDVCALRPEVTPDGNPRVRSLCESRTSTADLRGPAMGGAAPTGWGESMVGLPAGSPAGAALLGAPGSGDGGKVFLYPRAARGASEVDLSAVVAPGARLGQALAVGELAGGQVLFAAAAPGDSTVIVATLDASGGMVAPTVRGCLDAPGGAEGFGEALAIGNVDGTPDPEIVVGGDTAAGQVWLYSLADLGGPLDGCTGPAPSPAAQVACTELTLEDGSAIACDGSGFGATVDTGDVDADGIDELLVGAPAADVQGTTGAGAVWIYPSVATGGPDPDGARVLIDGQPDEGGRLGASLTTVATRVGTPEQRAEPVAGAPGSGDVLVFFCTGIGNDTATADSTRCVVQP